MTITYTILNKNVEGNRRVNYGTVTTTSSEGTLIINPGITYVDYATFDYSVSGTYLLLTYPTATSFPAKMASGYLTVIKVSGNDTVKWMAVGRA